MAMHHGVLQPRLHRRFCRLLETFSSYDLWDPSESGTAPRRT